MLACQVESLTFIATLLLTTTPVLSKREKGWEKRHGQSTILLKKGEGEEEEVTNISF